MALSLWLLWRPLLSAQPLPGQADMVGLVAIPLAVAPLLQGGDGRIGVLSDLCSSCASQSTVANNSDP